MDSLSNSPNILFLMTDQQRFDALSCHGGWIQTPNLDKLAAKGVDLQAHFSQAPVCVPSRCSIFSGRYGHSHRVLENDARLGPGEPHLFKVLKQAGYRLGYFGKNHLLPEEEMRINFDGYTEIKRASDPSPLRQEYMQLEKEAGARLSSIGSYASSQFHDFPDAVTTTGMITQEALNFLENAQTDQPWCEVVSYYDPHVPHLAPRRFAELYPLEDIPVPEHDPEELDSKAPRARIKYTAQNAHRATDLDKRKYLAVYAAMCSYLDEQMGHLLEALEKRPDAQNTLVVFISDHGDFGWHHAMCKKDLMLYDDLLKVPAILSWPSKIQSRRIRNAMTEHVDIMPTLLDLAGLSIPFGCQGKSMAPLLHGETDHHREAIHAEVCYPWMRCGFADFETFIKAWQDARGEDSPLGRSTSFNIPGDYTKCVRTRDWKYIWYGDGFEELYDLKSDPREQINLSGNPDHADTLIRLRMDLFQWLAQSADPCSPRSETEAMQEFYAWDSCPGIPRRG